MTHTRPDRNKFEEHERNQNICKNRRTSYSLKVDHSRKKFKKKVRIYNQDFEFGVIFPVSNTENPFCQNNYSDDLDF